MKYPHVADHDVADDLDESQREVTGLEQTRSP
jgi:hypothetical protein